MKRVIAITLAVVLIAAVFAGCSGKQKTSDSEAVSMSSYYEVIPDVPQERVAGQMQAASTFAGGSGTENDPYQIADAAQLAYFGQLLNDETTRNDYADKHYALTADIEWNSASEMADAATKAPSYAWEPAATHFSFKGSLNGNGHTITGLYTVLAIDPKVDQYSSVGLFYRVDKALIRDLTIADSYFYVYNDSSGVGAFAGEEYWSTFENCHTKRTTVAARVSKVGGIVGNTIGPAFFRNCSADGEIGNSESMFYAGGITASIYDGEIVNCVNHAAVTSHGDGAGGIVGSMATSAEYVSWNEGPHGVGKTTISGCENHGAVTSVKYCAGGIAGLATGSDSDGVIENCRNDGAVTGENCVAGIVAWATVSKNSTDKKAEYQGTLLIDRCENSGAITATEGVAVGLVSRISADNEATFTMTNCVNRGTTSSTGMTGGLIGSVLGTSKAVVRVSGCENAGTLTGDASCVGGLIGMVSALKEAALTIDFEKCVNSGAIESGSGYATGGLIGQITTLEKSKMQITFTACENTGLLTPKFKTATISFAGGLAGNLQNAGKGTLTLVRCANHGEIRPVVDDNKSESVGTLCHVGGLVGNCGGEVILQGCTQDGDVSAIPASIHYDPVCGQGAPTVQ